MSTQTQTAPAVIERNIADNVLNRVNILQKQGGLTLPNDYSAENALKSAWLLLQEAKDKSEKPALEVCTKESIANALLDMVVQGLNPVKKQVYFIVRGNKLCSDRSYFGSIALAKRAGMKDIVADVIYEQDVFTYAVDPKTGRKHILDHKQQLENIDVTKIKGAYAVYEMTDGTSDTIIMSKKQIEAAWNQGAMRGNSGAHKNFTDEMCKKSVINRACKTIINSSDDSYLYEGVRDPETLDTSYEEMPNEEIKANANREVIDIKPEPSSPTGQAPQVMQTETVSEESKQPEF
jgi:recombination protein RecT